MTVEMPSRGGTEPKWPLRHHPVAGREERMAEPTCTDLCRSGIVRPPLRLLLPPLQHIEIPGLHCEVRPHTYYI